jgi:hypothetical protein
MRTDQWFREFEKAVEPWCAKLAEQCGKTLAAEHQRKLMSAMRQIYEFGAPVQSN